MRLIVIALMLGALGCVDVGTTATTVDLSVSGVDMSEPFLGRFDVPIVLDRAEVAFGPFYLCAGTNAGHLCDEAVAELTDAVVVDAMDPAPTSVGQMEALDRTARSFMYDLGIVSRLTTPTEHLVMPAARSLGDASAVVEGSAEVEGQSIPFHVAVRIEQSSEAEQGVPVVRSGEEDGFEYRIRPDGTSRVLVRFDPRDWLTQANFTAMVEERSCSTDVEVACDGALEQLCGSDGSAYATRDCSVSGQVCLRGQGCADGVSLDATSQVGRALQRGLDSGAPPELIFESIE